MFAFFLFKLIVALIVVLALTLIAEYVSPRSAGILSGMPTGTAISLFFIGLEQGSSYVEISSSYNLTGLPAMQVFLFAFYLASKHIFKFSFIFSTSIGLLAYFISILAIRSVEFSTGSGILFSLLGMFLFWKLFGYIPTYTIKASSKPIFSKLFKRALFSTVIIASITSLSNFLPPDWVGLLTAFPLTLFPLMIIISKEYGVEFTYGIIKHVPQGIGSIIIFSSIVALTVKGNGIVRSTIFAYIGAIAYIAILLILGKIKENLADWLSTQDSSQS